MKHLFIPRPSILCILCMPGEGVKPTEVVCRGRGLLWLVVHIKWFIRFWAFEISSRASALATDPELLGDGSNTWTAGVELSHWSVNQIGVEEKRTTGLGKICRLPRSGLLLSLSPSFSNTFHELIKSILKQLFRVFLSSWKVIHCILLYRLLYTTATIRRTWNQYPSMFGVLELTWALFKDVPELKWVH